MNYESLGLMLKDARNAAHLTQLDVATKLNLTAQNISSWERGRSKIDIDSLFTLCDIYKTDCIKMLSQVSESQMTIPLEGQAIKKYHLLNEDGKAKADGYIEDLLDNPKYQASGDAQESETFFQVTMKEYVPEKPNTK